MAKFIEDLPTNSFNRRLAEGHLNRVGHKLDAVQVSDDYQLWTTVRKCCGQVIPETVAVLSKGDK